MLTKAEYSSIIKQVWADDFYEELRPQLGIASLIENSYEGLITSFGDTVKVQTCSTPGRAEVLTSDNEAYTVKSPVFSNIDLIINKMAVYPVDVTDWANYQANPKSQEAIRKIIAHEIARAIDQTIINLMAPSASQGGIAAIGKSHFAQADRVFNVGNIPDDGNRVCIIDPYYKEDLIQVNEIISRDFSPSSSAFMTGVLKDPIYSFKIYVSNLLPANTAMFFHKSFMNIGIQKGADYKEMDLESATNVPAKRVRGLSLFGVKQFDANRIYKIYNT